MQSTKIVTFIKLCLNELLLNFLLKVETKLPLILVLIYDDLTLLVTVFENIAILIR